MAMLRVLPLTFKPVLQQGKTRNIAIQLVLQQCCKTVPCGVIPVTERRLRHKSDGCWHDTGWVFVSALKAIRKWPILSRFLFASLCGKLWKMLFISYYFVLLSRKYVPVLCEDSSHNIPEVKRRGEYCTVGPTLRIFWLHLAGAPKDGFLKMPWKLFLGHPE